MSAGIIGLCAIYRLCGAGNQTKGFEHMRQTPYQLSMCTSPASLTSASLVSKDISLFIGRIHEYACSSPKIHELLRPSAPSCLPRPTKLCASFPQAPWCPLPSLALQMFSSPGLLQGLTTCQRKQRVHLSGSLQDRSLPGKTPPTLMERGKAWFSLSLPTKQGPQRSQGSLSPQKAI